MSRKRMFYILISMGIISLLSWETIHIARKNMIRYYTDGYVRTNHLSYTFALENIGYIAYLFYKQNEESIAEEYSRLLPDSPESKMSVRKSLLDKYMAFYENQKDLGLKQLNFHLSNGDSLLRLHRPHQFGDNLFSARESVRIANKKHLFVSGFEEGRIFNGFRYVYPIFYKGLHLGSFECSFDFSAIKREMKKTTASEITLAIRKDIVDEKVSESEKPNYTPYVLNKNFYIESNSKPRHDESSRKNSAKTIHDDDLYEKMANMEEVTTTHKDGNKYTITHLMPIKNIKDERVAYIVLKKDNIDIPALQYTFYIKIISWVLFLLLGLVYWINKIEKLNKKLKEKNEKLASALEEVKMLQGIIPICSKCKKIRNDSGYYEAVEEYFSKRADIDFSHTLCPDCADRLYGGESWYEEMKKTTPLK